LSGQWGPLYSEQSITIFSKDPMPFTIKRILVNNRTGIQDCNIEPNKHMMQGDKSAYTFPQSTCGVLLSLVIETDKGQPFIGTWDK
jgi:hypothetical protein